MESLQDILKTHQPLLGKSKTLDDIKQLLIKNNLKFKSIRLDGPILLITVENHLEATNIRYRSTFLLKIIESELKIKIKKIIIKNLL